MTKVGDEKVWNEITNNEGFVKILPNNVGEELLRNIISTSEIGIPCSLVLDVCKSADGFDIDLDDTKFAFLVR